MDNNFLLLKNKFGRLSHTHPNLSNLWEKYIIIKKKNFEDAMDECNTFIDNIQTNDDFEIETIITLLILKNNIRNI
jgi:hypothetical protein|tara:strand:+ start:1479 stop:1706 length:228 start_codon:yes stop_codon:yes gene_type:complete